VFRARIKAAFSVAGRGTFVAVEILDGEIQAGHRISVPLLSGERPEAEVSVVDFIDHVSNRRGDVALGVVGVGPGEVAVGQIIMGSNCAEKTVSAVVEALIERLLADPEEPERTKSLTRQHGALLVYESWTRYLFLRPDGSAFYIDGEEPGTDAVPGITEQNRAALALVLGARRWPELGAFLPAEDAPSVACPACNGTGMQKYGPHDRRAQHPARALQGRPPERQSDHLRTPGAADVVAVASGGGTRVRTSVGMGASFAGATKDSSASAHRGRCPTRSSSRPSRCMRAVSKARAAAREDRARRPVRFAVPPPEAVELALGAEVDVIVGGGAGAQPSGARQAPQPGVGPLELTSMAVDLHELGLRRSVDQPRDRELVVAGTPRWHRPTGIVGLPRLSSRMRWPTGSEGGGSVSRTTGRGPRWPRASVSSSIRQKFR
jgi:hypothetical protein